MKIETLFVQLQHNLVKAIPGDIAFDTTEANIVQAVHSNTNATNAIPTIQSSAAPRATSLKTEVPTTSQLRPIQNSAQKLPTPTPKTCVSLNRISYGFIYNYLITGFSKGFTINFHGSVGSNFSNNLFSAS